MPVVASDLFRLLAPCAPEALKVGAAVKNNPWSWIYIDVDQMINAQEVGKNNKLEKMMRHPQHKSKQLFLNGFKKSIANDPLRIDIKKKPLKLKKFHNHILSVRPPLNKLSDSLPYFNHLVEMVKNTPTAEKYTNPYNVKRRQKVYDSDSIIKSTGINLTAKLRNILPTRCVKLPYEASALEWMCGADLKRSVLQNDPVSKTYTAKNPAFIDNYIESAGIINDLIRFSKAQKWLSWQNSCGKGLAYTDNLKKLTDIAFERLIQINPFPTKDFGKISERDLDLDKRFREKKWSDDTPISAMLTWGNRLTKAYPDHPLLQEYKKINKVFSFWPEYSL
jgi:hypothetical protein